MPDVNDGYIELFRVLGQHGLIGVILGVIAIFGVICLTALYMMKGMLADSRDFTRQVSELTERVGGLKVKTEATDRTDAIQDSILTRHEDRLDNHEGRITVLENKED